MRKNLAALLLILLALGLSGCSRTSIVDINNTGYSSYSKKLSMQEMNDAILIAGKKLRWQMTKVSNGEISGTLTPRQHMATILVKYNPDMTFSIVYVSSVNLSANGKSIHKNYIRWVKNLEKAIGSEFVLILGQKQ